MEGTKSSFRLFFLKKVLFKETELMAGPLCSWPGPQQAVGSGWRAPYPSFEPHIQIRHFQGFSHQKTEATLGLGWSQGEEEEEAPSENHTFATCQQYEAPLKGCLNRKTRGGLKKVGWGRWSLSLGALELGRRRQVSAAVSTRVTQESCPPLLPWVWLPQHAEATGEGVPWAALQNLLRRPPHPALRDPSSGGWAGAGGSREQTVATGTELSHFNYSCARWMPFLSFF